MTTDVGGMTLKAGARLVSLLFENDFPAVLATPSGLAPQWFNESAAVVSVAWQ